MMTPLEMILIYIASPLLLTIGGGFVGWFFGRKKQKVETIDSEADTFNKLNETLSNQLTKLNSQNEEANRKIEALTNEVKILREEIERLQGYAKENEKLKKTNARYEKLLDAHNIDY